MKLLSSFLVFCLLCVGVGGCSWMGRTAGKAQAKLERKAQAVEDGYHEGYESEKAKTAPPQKSDSDTPDTPSSSSTSSSL